MLGSIKTKPLWPLFTFARFQWAVLLVAGLIALFFLVQVARFLPSADDNVYPEAAQVLMAQQWALGELLYRDFQEPPYLLTPFPPLWYASMAAAAKAGFSDMDSLTMFGRVLSLASLFAMVGLAYNWNRQRGIAVGIALLTPALYLSFPDLVFWATAARQDFPSLFFGFLAVFLVFYRTGPVWLSLAAVASACAFLLKHSAVAVPVAIVLTLLWLRRWKPAFLFCFVWAVPVGATLIGFEIASGGLMGLNLAGANFGEFSFQYSHEIFVDVAMTTGHGVVLFLLAAALLGLLDCWEEPDDRARFLGLYFVTSMGLAFLGSGFANAGANHYLEAAWVWALLAPGGLARLRRAWEKDSPLPAFVFVLALVLLFPALDVQRWEMLNRRPDNLAPVVPLVKGKRVLTDIPYLGARSRAPEFLDSISLTFAAKNGAWSSDTIVRSVRQKEYELVILRWRLEDPRWKTTRYLRLGDELRDAIIQSYAFCFGLDSSYVYGPLGEDDAGSHSPACLAMAEISLFSAHPSESRTTKLSALSGHAIEGRLRRDRTGLGVAPGCKPRQVGCG